MNLPEFISFTYKKLQNVVDFGGRRRNRLLILLVCIHMNLPEFNSFTYEKPRVEGAGGGGGWSL